MKASALIFAAALSLCAGAAMAACPDNSASNATDPNQTAGIAKDGTHAPLETPDAPESAQKDGSTMPLAGQEGGGDKNLATSQQDVEAQQKGDETAAAQADNCKE
jgi:hypothetical protein